MGKLQKLRSRLFEFVSSSVVKNMFAARLDPSKEKERKLGSDNIINARARDEEITASTTDLHWNEARRIYSEPAALLHRSTSDASLVSSLASQASDDVFLEGDDEEMSCEPNGFDFETSGYGGKYYE